MSSFAFRAAATMAALLMSMVATADDVASAANSESRSSQWQRTYEVTITNITRSQTFTPILVATHSPRAAIFDLGAPASPGLAILAEDGNPATLAAELVQTGEVLDSQTIPGLLAPGATATVQIRARGRFDQLSIGAMLIPTNDTFMALNSMQLPWHGSTSRTLLAYDAGSEPNDELCRSIPGPRCGGEGSSAGGGEGYVYVSNGMHGIGDLPAAIYDWRNPVARVVIRRID
jgi:hypothetical protein